ncbi:hypothetical protein ES705_12297 [subsurface metagenome]
MNNNFLINLRFLGVWGFGVFSPTSYKNGHIEYMEKQGEIFVCARCGLIKVPKRVEYDPREKRDEEEEEYVMCPKCSMYFARLHEESGEYYCEYCNHEFEELELE